MRNLKDIYKGEIIILGNAKIKPFDICYLMDETNDMVGAFEVEEVQHIFDQQSGFRTEIKPDMLVQASEWTLVNSAEALGIIAEEMMKKITGGGTTAAFAQLGAGLAYAGPASLTNAVGSVAGGGRFHLSPTAWIVGHAGAAFGGFMSNKILSYTQLAQPVVMSPLMHHGRVFAGGVATRKLPISLWKTIFGKWSSAVDTGYENWIEDVKADMLGWIEENTGQHTVGSFFDNGSLPIGSF